MTEIGLGAAGRIDCIGVSCEPKGSRGVGGEPAAVFTTCTHNHVHTHTRFFQNQGGRKHVHRLRGRRGPDRVRLHI